MNTKGVWTSPCHRYLPGGGLLCFLSKKSQIQMLDLASFSQATN